MQLARYLAAALADGRPGAVLGHVVEGRVELGEPHWVHARQVTCPGRAPAGMTSCTLRTLTQGALLAGPLEQEIGSRLVPCGRDPVGWKWVPSALFRYDLTDAPASYTRLMRWSFRRPRIVQRTCLDSGETWTIESSLAHVGSRGSPMTGTRQPLRTSIRGASNDFIADTYAELDQLNEMIGATRTCPKYGSEHFKDRRL